jgi:hypothetical protein
MIRMPSASLQLSVISIRRVAKKEGHNHNMAHKEKGIITAAVGLVGCTLILFSARDGLVKSICRCRFP